MRNILGWVVAGLIVGAIARLLVPGRQPMGLLMTAVLGIIGALVGGGLAWLIWGDPGEPFSGYAWPGYLFSVLGAALVLWVSIASAPREVG
jgi:uncharacterized membrane protein YeaQ/YmgE (transglycosylase-associated protein family)